ncbi:ABC transporter permease [Alistipes indistinctus]|jgi:putative ABC transport system permease protein|uniref:ABC transporter permease n=1 Tax=Alistipes indistinctus TaxID=626932 RepID=UPI000E4749B8|nr:ABC transporter permease [Alistipes indistinctus]RGU36622.1 ABC transporter permease [Alistipes indistinctus]
MYKIYLKQAWQMLMQNRFISIIAILGTALAIMMILVIVMADTVQNADAAPESNRSRTLYIEFFAKRDTTRGALHMGTLPYSLVKEYLLNLKTPELVTFVNEARYDSRDYCIINRQGADNSFDAMTRMTNDAYWKLMNFSFVSGRPFSKEEYDAGQQVAVISQSLATKLFPGEGATGKTVDLKFVPFRIVGVVKDVSPVFKEAAGDVWVPITAQEDYTEKQLIAMLRLRDKEDYPALLREIDEAERRFNLANKPWTLSLNAPYSHRTHTMGVDRYVSEKERQQAIRTKYRKSAIILLVLLLVPAVNLTGFSLSRMRKRMSEIGIRKAFGAKRHVILFQVLYENMLTSLIGGLLGLILSYPMVLWLRHWLLGIPPGGEVPAGTMLPLPVFLMTFLVCILLNLLSAGIPAYRAAKMSIVDSLYQNDQRS